MFSLGFDFFPDNNKIPPIKNKIIGKNHAIQPKNTDTIATIPQGTTNLLFVPDKVKLAKTILIIARTKLINPKKNYYTLCNWKEHKTSKNKKN